MGILASLKAKMFPLSDSRLNLLHHLKFLTKSKTCTLVDLYLFSRLSNWHQEVLKLTMTNNPPPVLSLWEVAACRA